MGNYNPITRYKSYRTLKRDNANRLIFQDMIDMIDCGRKEAEMIAAKRLMKVRKIIQGIDYLMNQQTFMTEIEFTTELQRLRGDYKFAVQFYRETQAQVHFFYQRENDTRIAMQRLDSTRFDTDLNNKWAQLGVRIVHLEREVENNEEARETMMEISEMVRASQLRAEDVSNVSLSLIDESDEAELEAFKKHWKLGQIDSGTLLEDTKCTQMIDRFIREGETVETASATVQKHKSKPTATRKLDNVIYQPV